MKSIETQKLVKALITAEIGFEIIVNSADGAVKIVAQDHLNVLRKTLFEIQEQRGIKP